MRQRFHEELRTLVSFEAQRAEDRVSGRTGLWFDLAEVKAAMLKIPGRKAKAGFGAYGPDAIIIDLPAQPIVVQRAPTDATR